jgi:hypothetical protein
MQNEVGTVIMEKDYYGGNYPLLLQKSLLISLLYFARGEVTRTECALERDR